MPLTDRAFYFADPSWGVYASSGQLVEAAALRQGADRALVGQSLSIEFNTNILQASPEKYVYGGIFNGHYGHFICSSLARLWYFCDVEVGDVRVVFHSHQSVAEMFDLPFVKYCFEQIGLKEENIVVFREPTRIKKLTVPLPSFSEQNFVHDRYRQLCHHIGANFLYSGDEERMAPVYLSKTALKSGVGRLTSEKVIEDILGGYGVQIVHPERMSFPEQVKMFSQPRIFSGTVGSSFHTSIFAPPRSKLVALSGFNSINSNSILIDKINQNNSIYLYPRNGAVMISDSNNFQGETIIKELDAVGLDLANLIMSQY